MMIKIIEGTQENQNEGAPPIQTVLLKKKKQVLKLNSDEQSFQPEIHQSKKMGLPINKKRLAVGSWTPEESKTYLLFMHTNRQDFQTQNLRRRKKVFYRLSKILKKRTPDQCRSHHQKLQIKCNENLDLIINSVREKVEKQLGQKIMLQRGKKGTKKTNENGPTQTGVQKAEEQYTKVKKDWFEIKMQDQNCLSFIISSSSVYCWP